MIRVHEGALVRAVFLSFFCRSLMAFLVALPVSAAITQSGLPLFEAADRVLFEPGGLMLLELLRLHGDGMSASLRSSAWLVLVWMVAGALPSALLFRAARLPNEPLRSAFYGSLPVFGRFVAFACLEFLAWLVALGVSLMLGHRFVALVGFGEVGGDAVQALFFVGGVALAAAISIVFDVARARSFEAEKAGFLKVLGQALTSAGSGSASLASAYLLTRGLGLLLVALGARAVELLDVGRPGGLRLLGVALTHQGVLLALSALRAAFALRVERTLGVERGASWSGREHYDRFEHSVEPGDPSPSHDA